jgi:hypothetical protein
MVASYDQWAVTLTEPAVGLPTDVLDDLRLCCQAQGPLAAALGGRAVGPGAFPQGSTGMGMTRLGDRALGAPFPRGRFRGEKPQALQQFSGTLEAGQIADVCQQGEDHENQPAAAGWERFGSGLQAPCFHGVGECLVQARESGGLCVHRPDIVWKDDVLRRSGTHACGEPPQGRWPPMGLACLAAIVPEQKGFAPKRGGLASAAGIFPGTPAGAARRIFYLGPIDGGASA